MNGYEEDVWWMMLLKGIALLLLGIVAIVWPEATVITVSLLFAVFLLITGVINIVSAIGSIKNHQGWFLRVILGILEVGAGVFLLKSPLVTAATLVLIVGITFIVQGIVAIIASFIDTDDAGVRFLAIIAGLLGIVAGFIVLRYPVGSTIAYVWILGAYGIIVGALEIANALSYKSRAKELAETNSKRAARR